MLKKVLITLKKNTQHLSSTIASLKEHQISYQFISAANPLPPLPGCLLITDDADLVNRAKKHEMACLAYASTPDKIFDFPQAAMVTEGFLEIDADFLTYVYCRFHHLPVTIAETNRLLLKELPPCDLKEMYRISHHPSIRIWIDDMPDSFEIETKKHQAYIKNVYEFYGYGYWGVYLKDSGRLIGKCGLQNRETPSGIEVELGYFIDPDVQNNGYATEAALTTIEYAFHTLELPKIIAVIRKDNVTSLKVAAKLGFLMDYETTELIFLKREKKPSAS